MAVNETSEQSVDKAVGDDLAKELRTIKEFVKALEARKTADDTIASNTAYLDYLKEKMAVTSRNSSIDDRKDTMCRLEENLDETNELIKEQEKLIAKQERRISLQEQRILALEEKVSSLFTDSPTAKTGR